MSWAEFKDFEINLTEATANSVNSSQISASYLPEGVTQIFYGGDRNAARNGGQHGWQYAAFQFDVDGPVDIIVGGCLSSQVNATVTDDKGNLLKELATGEALGCGGVAIYKYTGDAATLRVYCGQYCPSIKVQKPTKENFVASWDWTKKPAALNKEINYSVGWLSADNGISMYVDANASKLYAIGRDNAQFNKNARLLVPVYGINDEIAVIGYPDYTGFSIHGVNYTSDATGIKANAEDVMQGYIVITSTDDNKYIKTVTLKHNDGAPSPITFKDFAIDFQANPYKVTLPGDGKLPSNVTVNSGTYNGAQHGVQNPTITVGVTGPVKFTIGSCHYGGHTVTIKDEDGNTLATVDNDKGCDNVNQKTKYVEWIYNKEKAATLTFAVNGYLPFFNAEELEYVPDVEVSYYDTNGRSIGKETVEGYSTLKFKFGESDVTVASGKKFRGWYDGNGLSAKPVEEGIALTKDIKLYAKATVVEEATTTSTHIYDLTKSNWYQNEHDLIEITGGKWNDGQHGWSVGAGSTVKLQVAGDALITVSNCQFAHEANMTLTDASNNVIGVASAKAPEGKDGETVKFKYSGGATTLTLTYAGVAYIHNISVEHFASVAFEPFKIDFRSRYYTVVLPEEGLPANVQFLEGSYHDDGSGPQNKYGYKKVKLKVLVDRPVKFYIGACDASDQATVSVDDGTKTVIETNTFGVDALGVGSSYDNYVTYVYKGTEPAVILFDLGMYCPYFFAEEWESPEYDEATKTFNVAADNVSQLRDAISEANAMGGNVTIYLPNGTYDLGSGINTEIKGNNIAIIGESRDGVIIMNSPAKEGLDNTATLKNSSTGLYLQDLTIQCYAPYDPKAKAERGVAFWDRGTKTICKNVYLKGQQDTYYSNGAEGMIAYFEGGKIEGAVDFICGSGNVLFNSVTLNVIATEHTQSGGCIAAPSTYSSENGYVFANCLVTAAGSQKDTYYLARGWQNSPAALFVLTKFAVDPSSEYWGHNIADLDSRRFAAYGTGAAYDANTTSITKASLVNFAGDWDPAAIISLHSPIKTNAAGWASYTAFTDVYLKGEDVKAYTAIQINKNSVLLKTIDDKVIPAGTAVFVKGAEETAYNVNGAVVGKAIGENYLKPVLFDTPLTSGQNAFVIGTRDGVCGLYLVNSNIVVPAGKCYLNAGEASLVLAKDELQIVFYDSEATGINNVDAETDADAFMYNLSGQKVGNGYKGIVVRKDGKKYMAK